MVTRSTRKVFNICLTNQTYIFLWTPKNTSLKKLNQKSRGVNWNNRPLHFSGIKDMKDSNKFNWKSTNHFNARKLNSKYHRYLMLLISLDDIKLQKKIKIKYPVRRNIYLNHKKDDIFRVTYTFLGRLNKILTLESV